MYETRVKWIGIQAYIFGYTTENYEYRNTSR